MFAVYALIGTSEILVERFSNLVHAEEKLENILLNLRKTFPNATKEVVSDTTIVKGSIYNPDTKSRFVIFQR